MLKMCCLVASYLECRLQKEARLLHFFEYVNSFEPHIRYSDHSSPGSGGGECLTVNGSIFNVFPKYFGPEWKTGFIVRDCQGRQRARQADMTQSTITLERGLLLFRAVLCVSLRESRLSGKAFPAVNHIFPFAALNASEGLRHKTK